VQTDDGELRLSHPLPQHLGRCAALFREACECIAAWLSRAIEAAGRVERVEDAGASDLTFVTHVRFPAAPPGLLSQPADTVGGRFFGDARRVSRTMAVAEILRRVRPGAYRRTAQILFARVFDGL
jgi:hypothetical protein